MKLFVKLEWMQIDPAGVRGEDFDAALEEQIEGLEIEGWELKSAVIDRGDSRKSDAAERSSLIESIGQLAELCLTGQAGQPSKKNPAISNADLLRWQLELARKCK